MPIDYSRYGLIQKKAPGSKRLYNLWTQANLNDAGDAIDDKSSSCSSVLRLII